jgi:hypothetical protein
MEKPTVQARIRDPKTDVKYEVCAYRKLTRAEAITAIAYFNSQQKRKPKAGSVITIVTTIGFND